MSSWIRLGLLVAMACPSVSPAAVTPAPQKFRQQIALRFNQKDGLPNGPIQLVQAQPGQPVRAFAQGQWFELNEGRWLANQALQPASASEFAFAGPRSARVAVSVPWRSVQQVIQGDSTDFLATAVEVYSIANGKASPLSWNGRFPVHQIAAARDGRLWLASSSGLFQLTPGGWAQRTAADPAGRAWATTNVLGVAIDAAGRLWFATKAGVGCQTEAGWKFYEGKDGLPWNDFTGMEADAVGGVWFSTHLGVIHFDGRQWSYRQGPGWLPNDDVSGIAVNRDGAWFATAQGVGAIQQRPMSLGEKAAFYEEEVQRYIKRTPFGYVAEAHLRVAADKSSADPQDSDNDGLWTAMYGAGECFAYGATKDPAAKKRADQAFEALRFLQVVTQGGEHSPPPGYIARTIRPVSWPDPNVGRLEGDKKAHERDPLWKVYEPRWPKSADGQWFWKSDTSSDELDGHFFFYGIYYDLCAETGAEKDRVREVVRGIADHLISHGFLLIDHDGRPTRWGIYAPDFLNRDPIWWPERGLNSLSVLSYLAVAGHVTGDPKYGTASRELIEQHGYAHNAMYPKVQNGPGSGNQSDDEMAFMCFYSLLRCSDDPVLKNMIRLSFYRYWLNEAPEMNPFFNFAYAGQNLHATATNAWGTVPLRPWADWQSDAMQTLYGFPLDRLNWSHRNSHRLDLIPLTRGRAEDFAEDDRDRRGERVNGKVLPVENRYFTHWNTDPWQLDYQGSGDELGAGTAFLLPYYLGVYHGFIEPPAAPR